MKRFFNSMLTECVLLRNKLQPLYSIYEITRMFVDVVVSIIFVVKLFR